MAELVEMSVCVASSFMELKLETHLTNARLMKIIKQRREVARPIKVEQICHGAA